MRIRVLMVTNKQGAQHADAEMLKDRGFLVYNCTEPVLDSMIGEVKPDVVFINPEDPGLHSTKVYHDLLDDANYARIPVIYALNEDDTYLVSRRRTARNARNMMTDNVVDGIKLSLLPEIRKNKKPIGNVHNQLCFWEQNANVA